MTNTLQDIVLTMFMDADTQARTHARTNRTKTVCLQPHYVGLRHNNFTATLGKSSGDLN